MYLTFMNGRCHSEYCVFRASKSRKHESDILRNEDILQWRKLKVKVKEEYELLAITSLFQWFRSLSNWISMK